MTEAKPLVRRLNTLFMGKNLVRNIVSQRKTTINFRQAIERHEIILIKVPVNSMGESARLIAMMLIAQINAAIFSFADTHPDQRSGVSLYVDEFQNFPTTDYEKLFVEGRKYGARLTVAHQSRAQMTTGLKTATLNARTIVCFHLIPDDASSMAKEFPEPEGTLEVSSRPTKELLSHSAEYPPVVREFVETYLRTVPKSGKVEIEQKMGAVDYLLRDGKKPIPIHQPSPIGALDTLFYHVMATHNPYYEIPGEAVYGLANGGIGFQGAINIFNSGVLRKDVYDFPDHFVIPTPHGLAWGRKPQSAKEQLLHCIFHLRMTMHYLAQHPVGKTVRDSNDVASQLTQLPVRVALVKAEKTSGRIRSHDNPPQLTGLALEQRMQTVRDQTRAKYCHPRSEVEGTSHPVVQPLEPDGQDLTKPDTFHLRHTPEGTFHLRNQPPAKSPISRWEEVDT